MKTSENFVQRGIRFGSSGGFVNQLMSKNSTTPIVGNGATILYHSDRCAYEVLSFDEKQKMAIIRRYKPKRIDKNTLFTESQEYEYSELEGPEISIFFRNGKWKIRKQRIVHTMNMGYPNTELQYSKMYVEKGGKYDDNGNKITIIEGFTKKINEWHPINIIFGVKEEYYNYSM